MRPHRFSVLLILLFLFLPSTYAQDPIDIIRKADDLMRGKSSYARITMTIVKPDWQRTMSMKAWSLEPKYSLIYVTELAQTRKSTSYSIIQMCYETAKTNGYNRGNSKNDKDSWDSPEDLNDDKIALPFYKKKITNIW